ncbi:hypothetical protein BZA77DRAFT_356164 [Pyronema omphalodes]|nr:hypothetical protein BZA77DRAFT_356164 [Pyronema omphalodes]
MKRSTLAILIGCIAANALAGSVVPKDHGNEMRIQARYEPASDIAMDADPVTDIKPLMDYREVSGQPHGLPHHDHEHPGHDHDHDNHDHDHDHTDGTASSAPIATEVYSGPAITSVHDTMTTSFSYSGGSSATESAGAPGITHGPPSETHGSHVSAPVETHSSIKHSSGVYCTPKTSHAGSCSACTVTKTTYISGSTSASSAEQTHTASHSSEMGSSSISSGKPSSSMYYGNTTFTSKWASSTDPATSIIKNGTVTTGLPPIATHTGGAGFVVPSVGLIAVVAAGVALL